MHSIYTILLLLPFITVHHAFVQHHSQHWPFTKSNIEKLIKKKNVDALRKKLSIPSYGEVINYRRENNKIDPDEFFRKSITPRIFNGEESDPSDFQYMVSLKWPFDDGYLGGHYCGGTLIAENVVLTAAHCILGEYEVEVAVKGDTKHNDGSETFRSVGPGVIYPYDHNLNTTYMVHDIAILYLDGRSTIQPVSLSNTTDNGVTEAILLAWGLRENGTQVSEHLVELDIELMSNEECSKTYMDDNIVISHLCAKDDTGYPGFNAGAPLLLNEGNELKQIGIVASAMNSDMYTRISYYHPWIMEQLNEYPPTPYPTALQSYTESNYIDQYHVGYTPKTYVSTQYFQNANCTIPIGESETNFKMVQEQHVCRIATSVKYTSGIVSDIDANGIMASCDNGSCTMSYHSGMSCVNEPDDQITGSEDSCIPINYGSLKLKLETSIPSGQARFDFGEYDRSKRAASMIESYFLSTEECTTVEGSAFSATCNNGIGAVYYHENGCESEGFLIFPPLIHPDVEDVRNHGEVVIRCENGK